MYSSRPFLDQLLEHGLQTSHRAETMETAKLRLLDYIGALMEGVEGETARIFGRLADTLGGNAQSCFVPTGKMTTMLHAAAGNAAVAHANETDDVHTGTTGYHPGVAIIPAVLAVAEMRGGQGLEILRAIVAAYEVSGRIGAAVTPSHRARGFHATGTIGALGAATGAAMLWGMDKEQAAGTIGLATSLSGGTFAVLAGGAQGKHLHAAHAAMSGVYATLLSDAGMVGSRKALEAPGGFFDAFADAVDTERLLSDNQHRAEIDRVMVKPYPCCAHLFGAVEIAIDLSATWSPESIEAIEVTSYNAAVVLDNRQPSSVEEAKLSLPFCLAAALLNGRLSSMDFECQMRAAVDQSGLMERISVIECPEANAAFPQERRVTVALTAKNGKRVVRSGCVAPGFPGRELSKLQILNKFREATARLGGRRPQQIESLVMNFDQYPDAAMCLARTLTQ